MKTVARITVRGYHVDHFGHVNHGRYVEILEEARWQYLEVNGLLDAIHALNAIHVVSHLEIAYRAPARAMDVLRIETTLASRSSCGFVMRQEIFLESTNRGALLANVSNVFVDRRGRPKPTDERLMQVWADLGAAELCSTQPR